MQVPLSFHFIISKLLLWILGHLHRSAGFSFQPVCGAIRESRGGARGFTPNPKFVCCLEEKVHRQNSNAVKRFWQHDSFIFEFMHIPGHSSLIGQDIKIMYILIRMEYNNIQYFLSMYWHDLLWLSFAFWYKKLTLSYKFYQIDNKHTL